MTRTGARTVTATGEKGRPRWTGTLSGKMTLVMMGIFLGFSASYIMKPVAFEALQESIRAFDLYWTLSELPQ